MRKGKLVFKENETFTFQLKQNHYNSPYYLTLLPDKNVNSSLFLEISKETRGFSTFIDLKNVDCHELFSSLSFFSENINEKLEQVEGRLEGTFACNLEKNGNPKFSANLTFANLCLKEKLTHKLFKAKKLNLHFSSNNEEIKSFFVKKLGVNCKLCLILDKGELFSETEAKPLLKDLSLNLYYDPSLGAKLHLQTQAYYCKCEDNQVKRKNNLCDHFIDREVFEDKALAVRLTSEGIFCSDVYNCLSGELAILGLQEENCCFFNLEEKDNNRAILEASLKHIGPEYLAILKPYLKNDSNFKQLNFLEGTLASEVEAHFFSDRAPSISIKNIEGKQLAYTYKDNIFMQVKDLKGDLEFDLQKGISKSLSSTLFVSDAKLKGILLSGKTFDVEGITCSFVCKDGMIFPSSASAEIQKLHTTVKFNGKLNEFIANAEVKGCLDSILNNSSEDQISAILTFRKKREGGCFSGIVQLADKTGNINEQGNVVFGTTIKDFTVLDLKKSLVSMWARGENIVLEKFQGVLPLNEKIQGKVNFIAFLQKDKFSLQWQAKNFKYENKYYTVYLDKVGSSDANFLEKKDNVFIGYDLANNSFDIEIPEVEGSYYLKKFDLSFICKKTKIKVVDKLLEFSLPEVCCENINLAGKVFLDFSDRSLPKLDIVTDAVNGNVNDLKNLVQHFNVNIAKLSGLQGNFESKEQGFYFSKVFDENNEEKASIGASIFFKDIDYKVTDDLFLSKTSFCFNWDNKENILDLCAIDGQIILNGTTYYLLCPLFSKKDKNLSYDIRIGNATLDLLRFKGHAFFSQDEIDIALNKELSHFLGSSFDVHTLKLDDKLQVKALDLDAKIDFSKTLSFINFLPYKYLSILEKIKNEFFLKLQLDENKTLRFNCKSKGETPFFQNLFLEGRKDKNEYIIEKLLFDSFSASFSIYQNKDIFKIENLHVQNQKQQKIDVLIEGAGKIDLKNKKCDFTLSQIQADNSSIIQYLHKASNFNINSSFLGKGYLSLSFVDKFFLEADLDLSHSKIEIGPILLENEGPLNVYYSSNNDLKIRGLNLSFSSKEVDLSLLKTEFKYINYNVGEKKFDLEEGKIYVPKDLIKYTKNICSEYFSGLLGYALDIFKFDRDLDFEAHVEYFPETKILKAYSKDAIFYINGKPRNLKNLVFSQKKAQFILEFDYLLTKDYHHITNILECSSGIEGKLIIGKETNPLRLYWTADRDGVKVNRLKGNYCGIFADFFSFEKSKDKMSYALSGSLKIDFSQALPYLFSTTKFDLRKLGLTSGYELKGKISFEKQIPNFIDFEGTILGKDFGIMGYKIKTMLGNIYFDGNFAKIRDLKISDVAGIVQTDEVIFEKKEGIWNFSIPQIILKECRPSLLKTLKQGSEEEIKPLLIKNFKITDLKGNFENLSSITGKGDFSFLNSFKRGKSIFEIPADVLGMIVGLDQELLIPVMGDIFFEIKNNKVLFYKINEVYSENRRSKFFLVDVPSMDFDGNLDVNIKMKQYVLFKITDKFILSIKGNVKKPEYTLKKRRLFQSNS